MIKEYIAEAATIEEAMSLAVAGLAAPETADVQYEVLAQPKKKTFGLFGGSPARVKAYYEAPDAAVKPKKEENFYTKELPILDLNKKEAPKEKPAPREKAAPKEKTEKAPKEKAPKEKPQVKAEEDDAFTPEETPAVPVPEDDAVGAYIKKIVTLMGLSHPQMTYSVSEKAVTYHIDSDGDQGLIIGRRGETLDALQYLARLVANKDGKDYERVNINVGDYREKRMETLRGMAERSAARVLKYGRNVSLDPMNPYERRIIHTAIQEIDGVYSFSVGTDDARRVVIAKEGSQFSGGRGGYRGNNYNRGGKGSHSRGGNRERGAYTPSANADAKPRVPKNDAAGSGLYGKIEIKKETEE